VKGILEAYLGGQAVGFATVNLLFGKANPSGKLPETFPIKLEDNPSYLYFKGEEGKVEYREGVFVGYRYYETKKMDVLFPFGHGLSYTNYEYSNLTLDKASMKDTDCLTVSVDVKNTGKLAGKEVVQLYVAPKGGEIIRPAKELREFEKVELQPGETKTVTFKLNKRAFAYWNTKIHDWHVESGTYEVMIGRSVRDIVETKEIQLESTVNIPTLYTMNSTFGEIMKNPKAMTIMGEFMTGMSKMSEGMGDIPEGVMSAEAMQAAMMESSPRMMLNFMPGLNREDLQRLLDAINQ
jgi:beta-glucosidase